MHQYTKQEKLDWLGDWKTSKKSAKSFAEDKSFSTSSLNYWKRKYKSTTKSSFIQIVPDQIETSPYARLTYRSGDVIEIYSPVSSAYIKGLLK